MKAKKFLQLLLACILVIMINGVSKVHASGLTFASVSGNAPFYYIQVTLTNSQSSATSPSMPQVITINSNANAAEYASNLDNVNWQDGAGNILSSWLESGETSTSSSSVYWVNLGSNTIASNGGTFTVYEVIYATTVNCMNTINTGAEPLHTGTYGQYDDGIYVFTNYWNWAGTSMPSGWTRDILTVGSASVNNGLTLVYTPNSAYYYSATYNPQTYAFDTYGYIGTQNSTPEKNIGWINGGSYSIGYNWFSGASYYETTVQSSDGMADSSNEIYSPNIASGTTGVFSAYATLSAAMFSFNNYLSYVAYGGTYFSAQTSLNVWFASQNYRTVFSQWARIRILPPSGVMPTVTISAPIAVPEFPSILILPLFMIATLLAVIAYKKKVVITRQS